MKGSERRAFRVAYAAWLLGIFAFFVPAATWSPVSRFALTRSILEQATLSIDVYVSSTGDRARVGERWYTDKAPVPSLLAVIPYALVRGVQALRNEAPDYRASSTPRTPALRVKVNRAFQQALYACSVVTSGLSGAAVGLLLFEFLRRRTTARTALAGSVLSVLGTPLFPYATSFYGHVPAAAFLLAGLVFLDRRSSRPPGPPSPSRLRSAGACLALAPGCEYLTLVPVGMIGIWVLVRATPPDRLATALNLALGALGPVAVVSAYHHFAFGAPWRTGYSFVVQPEFAAGHAQGLLGIAWLRPEALFGLSFGLERGLFYIAPVALVGIVLGLRYAYRRKDFEQRAALAALGLLFALNASYYMWWGGASAGPRHLVPALPALGLGIALALREKHKTVRLLTLGFAGISVANCLAITAVGLEAPRRELLLGYAWSNLLAGKVAFMSGASNIGLKIGLPGAWSLLPLLLWCGLGGWYLLGMLRRGRRRGPTQAAGRTRPSRH